MFSLRTFLMGMFSLSRENDLTQWLREDGQKFLRSLGVREGQVLLDYGCGEGHYTLPAAQTVGEKGKVYAQDQGVSSQIKKQLQKYNIQNTRIIEKKTLIPLEDHSVDFILCYDVLHYLEERKKAYQEFNRVLKSSGTLSVYPKHHKDDDPLMGLAHIGLDEIAKEIEETGFSLKAKLYKKLIHDESITQGCVLNFQKRSQDGGN